MGFSSSKQESLLILFLVVIVFACNQESKVLVQARAFLVQPETKTENMHANTLFSSLGLVCKCCDDAAKGGGECVATWKGTCSDLQCSPWKSQTRHRMLETAGASLASH